MPKGPVVGPGGVPARGQQHRPAGERTGERTAGRARAPVGRALGHCGPDADFVLLPELGGGPEPTTHLALFPDPPGHGLEAPVCYVPPVHSPEVLDALAQYTIWSPALEPGLSKGAAVQRGPSRV